MRRKFKPHLPHFYLSSNGKLYLRWRKLSGITRIEVGTLSNGYYYWTQEFWDIYNPLLSFPVPT